MAELNRKQLNQLANGAGELFVKYGVQNKLGGNNIQAIGAVLQNAGLLNTGMQLNQASGDYRGGFSYSKKNKATEENQIQQAVLNFLSNQSNVDRALTKIGLGTSAAQDAYRAKDFGPASGVTAAMRQNNPSTQYKDYSVSTRQSGNQTTYMLRGVTNSGSKSIGSWMNEKELKDYISSNISELSSDQTIAKFQQANQRASDMDAGAPGTAANTIRFDPNTGQPLQAGQTVSYQGQQYTQGQQFNQQGGAAPTQSGQSSATSQAAQGANTLYDFYTAQGKTLPGVSDRAPLFSDYGGTGNYTGTAAQNTFLLGKLKGGLPQTQAPNSAGAITATGAVNLSSPTSGTGGITQAQGANAGVMTSNNQQLTDLQSQITQAQTQQKGLLSQFMGAQQQGRAELRAELEAQYAIQAKSAEIDSLTQSYNLSKSAMDTEVNNSSNRLATTGFISKEQNAIERKYAPTLNRISADINSKTALLTRSNDLVNQAIGDAVADQKYKVDMFKMFYDMNQDNIDRLDDQYKDALKEAQRLAEREYDEALEEKRDVANLMMNNPNAGVTTNDSYSQAASKVSQSGGSLAARQEKRLGNTSTSSTSNSTSSLDSLAQDYLDGVIDESDIPMKDRAAVKKKANDLALAALNPTAGTSATTTNAPVPQTQIDKDIAAFQNRPGETKLNTRTSLKARGYTDAQINSSSVGSFVDRIGSSVGNFFSSLFGG